MLRIWSNIVVAGLVMLGDSAIASASNEHCGDSQESNGSAIQLILPTVLDNSGPRSQPSLASGSTIQQDINRPTQSFTAVTALVSDLLKYHPFNPRAPPVPAN